MLILAMRGKTFTQCVAEGPQHGCNRPRRGGGSSCGSTRRVNLMMGLIETWRVVTVPQHFSFSWG
jgi:hypothetical protein